MRHKLTILPIRSICIIRVQTSHFPVLFAFSFCLHTKIIKKSHLLCRYSEKLLIFAALNKTINNMDRKTLEFVTYCIGRLSVLLKLPQREIYKRLKESGILFDYIVPSYDVLHTFSSRYLMEDLTDYMKEKGVL